MGEVVHELTPSWHAAQRASAVAIVMASSGEATTYGELEQRSRALAGVLQARGHRPPPRAERAMRRGFELRQVSGLGQPPAQVRRRAMPRRRAQRGAQSLERGQLRPACRAGGQVGLELVDRGAVELPVEIGLQQRPCGFTFHARVPWPGPF